MVLGVSVVNALSAELEVKIRRDSKEFQIDFADGEKTKELHQIGEVGVQNSGTTIRFLPNSSYFESDKIQKKHLKHLLKAKAVLCPGLQIDFLDEKKSEKIRWLYEDGLSSYLSESSSDVDLCP